MSFKLIYKPFGESAILIEWPARIEEEIIQDIVDFKQKIEENYFRLDTIVAYNSLTIKYDDPISNYEREVATLSKIYHNSDRAFTREKTKLWQIPVCYDIAFGLDLQTMAESKKLSVEEIIELHTKPNYLIYFLGFQPGFLYLGGLDAKLHTPRIATPRLRVSKGSVGIGGEQTGVYPSDSAGGWNIIGRSPINFFDVSKSNPCFANAGDKVQFVPVDKVTFYKIEEEVNKGNYQLKSKRL